MVTKNLIYPIFFVNIGLQASLADVGPYIFSAEFFKEEAEDQAVMPIATWRSGSVPDS
jgi:hypothetical protein